MRGLQSTVRPLASHASPVYSLDQEIVAQARLGQALGKLILRALLQLVFLFLLHFSMGEVDILRG